MGRGLALVAFVFLGLFLDHSGSGSRVASESPEEATEGARFVAEVQEQGCWKEGAQKNCNLSKHPASASRVHASRDDESKAVDVPEVLGNNTHECVVLPFMSFMVADSASYSIALQVQEEEDRGEQAEAQERRRQRESRERALPYALLQSEERGQRARGCAMGADHAIDQNRCGNSRGTGGGPTFAPSARIATATRSTGDPSRGSCQGGRSEKDLGSCIQSGDRGKDLGVGSKSVGSAGQSRNYSWRLEQDLTGKEAIPQSQRGCCQNRQGLVAFCKDDPSSICARASCVQGAKGRSYQGAAVEEGQVEGAAGCSTTLSAVSIWRPGGSAASCSRRCVPFAAGRAGGNGLRRRALGRDRGQGVREFYPCSAAIWEIGTFSYEKGGEARGSPIQEAEESKCCCQWGARVLVEEFVFKKSYVVLGTTTYRVLCPNWNWIGMSHLAPFLADYDCKPVRVLQFTFSWFPGKRLFPTGLDGLGYKDYGWLVDGHPGSAKSSAFQELCVSSSAVSACSSYTRAQVEACLSSENSILQAWWFCHGWAFTQGNEPQSRPESYNLSGTSANDRKIAEVQWELLIIKICFDCATVIAGLLMGLKRILRLCCVPCIRRKRMVVVKGSRHQVVVQRKPRVPVRLIVFMIYLILTDAQLMDPRNGSHDKGIGGQSPQEVRVQQESPATRVVLGNQAVWASIVGAIQSDLVPVVVHSPDRIQQFHIPRTDLVDVEWPQKFIACDVAAGSWNLWPVTPQPSSECCALVLAEHGSSEIPIMIGLDCQVCVVPRGQAIHTAVPGEAARLEQAATGYWYRHGVLSDSSVLMQTHVGFTQSDSFRWHQCIPTNKPLSVKVWKHSHLVANRFLSEHRFARVCVGQCLQSVIVRDFDEWIQGRDFAVQLVVLHARWTRGCQVILHTRSAFPLIPILVRVTRDFEVRVGTILFREGWDDFRVKTLFDKIDPVSDCVNQYECFVREGDNIWHWNQIFRPIHGRSYDVFLRELQALVSSSNSTCTSLGTQGDGSLQLAASSCGSMQREDRDYSDGSEDLHQGRENTATRRDNGSLLDVGEESHDQVMLMQRTLTEPAGMGTSSTTGGYGGAMDGANTATPRNIDGTNVHFQWARVLQASRNQQSLQPVVNFATPNFVRADQLRQWIRDAQWI